MVDFAPSFIAEVVVKAKMYTFHRTGKFVDLKGSDIILAAETLKAHQELMNKNHEQSDPTNAELLEAAIAGAVTPNILTALKKDVQYWEQVEAAVSDVVNG
jgi:uncharacterized OsmC-like protein